MANILKETVRGMEAVRIEDEMLRNRTIEQSGISKHSICSGRNEQGRTGNAGQYMRRSVWFYIFDDVGDRTVKDKTKRVQRLRGDRFSLFHAVQGIGGYAMFEDQFVFGDVFLKQGVVKGFIGNQIEDLSFCFFQKYHISFVDHT